MQTDAITDELLQRLSAVLAKYKSGPTDGVFTDGACSGNPGPGGWGTVHVVDNQVVAQQFGYEDDTTNNRMELCGLLAGYQMLPTDSTTTIYTDSQLCVNTFTQWIEKWRALGWRRPTGPIKNLELVKQVYEQVKAHPKVKLVWIKAHNGSRWNEYADTLSTAYLK